MCNICFRCRLIGNIRSFYIFQPFAGKRLSYKRTAFRTIFIAGIFRFFPLAALRCVFQFNGCSHFRGDFLRRSVQQRPYQYQSAKDGTMETKRQKNNDKPVRTIMHNYLFPDSAARETWRAPAAFNESSTLVISA